MTTWHSYPQKLTVTSPTSVYRSVSNVRSRTQATEFVFVTGCSRKKLFVPVVRFIDCYRTAHNPLCSLRECSFCEKQARRKKGLLEEKRDCYLLLAPFFRKLMIKILRDMSSVLSIGVDTLVKALCYKPEG
jgi:hypothetical protein